MIAVVVMAPMVVAAAAAVAVAAEAAVAVMQGLGVTVLLSKCQGCKSKCEQDF